MNWTIIFNPFSKFSDRTLLIVGILSVVFGSFIGYFFSITFDGILDAHSLKTDFTESLKENSINIIIVFILLLILGKIINKKTRAIDIFNISIIYRIPIYLSSPLINLPVFEEINQKVLGNKGHLDQIKFDTADLILVLATTSVLMIFLIYAIVLLVNGFRTATNLKKWQPYIYFTLILILAETLSKILFSQL